MCHAKPQRMEQQLQEKEAATAASTLTLANLKEA
jgi:hypothetical protein